MSQELIQKHGRRGGGTGEGTCPLPRMISSPNIILSPLNSITTLLEDSSLVNLMKTCKELYNNEYSNLKMKNYYNMSTIGNPKPKILKLVWDIENDKKINEDILLKIKDLDVEGDWELLISKSFKSLEFFRLDGHFSKTTYNIDSEDLIQIVKFLKPLQNLNSIDFNNNNLHNINCLSNISDNLTSLDLRANELDNIDCLAKFINLTSIDLSHNAITKIECLAKMPNLTSVELVYNNIQNLDPLVHNSKIEYLNLASNMIRNIDNFSKALKTHNSIKTINLSNNFIAGRSSELFKALEYNSSLEILHLEGNSIYDLDKLTVPLLHSRITELNFGNNKIKNLCLLSIVLNDNKFVKILNLRNNRLDDIVNISEMLSINSSITEINLSSNKISNIDHLLQISKNK